MIEPTESESKAELDRFCDAMIAIREEIAAIEAGTMPREDNPLKNAPHTAGALLAAEWPHPYPRERAAFPLPYVRAAKFWPPVGRINNVLGDRKLVLHLPRHQRIRVATVGRSPRPSPASGRGRKIRSDSPRPAERGEG